MPSVKIWTLKDGRASSVTGYKSSWFLFFLRNINYYIGIEYENVL